MGPLVRPLWKDKATEAVLDFLRSTRVGCLVTLMRPPEEEEKGETDGEEDEPGPP